MRSPQGEAGDVRATHTDSLEHPAPQAQTNRVVSHTTLIYWWPGWLVGFILAALTALSRRPRERCRATRRRHSLSAGGARAGGSDPVDLASSKPGRGGKRWRCIDETDR